MWFTNFTLAAGQTAIEWLPSGSFFDVILLDPASAQSSASLLSYEVKGSSKEKIYSPINLGIQKMIGRYSVDQNQGFEVGLEFGIHSQFTIVDSGETLLGGLQNTDYRVAAIINYKRNRSVYRVSFFHQSSHLGDDYMLRSEYFQPNTKVLNYEQVDFTQSIQLGQKRYYYSLAYNVSPNTTRKRIGLQAGYFYKSAFHKAAKLTHLYGFDLKFYEQNNYSPTLKAGIGIELAPNSPNSFIILLEYYEGHLPYSTLEFQQVKLLGLGIYFRL